MNIIIRIQLEDTFFFYFMFMIYFIINEREKSVQGRRTKSTSRVIRTLHVPSQIKIELIE